MSIWAKRAAWVVPTVIGLTLLVVGLWFAGHLGASGSATFSVSPKAGGVVVLEPSVLNRPEARVPAPPPALGGARLWVGRATPSDASTLVGGAARTTVTGFAVREWSLRSQAKGAGPTPTLAGSDIWRQQASGADRVTMTVQQPDAPEAVVIGSADGRTGLESVTVTVAKRTWFFQSLMAALVGLIALAAGGFGLWSTRPRGRARRPDHREADGSEVRAPGQPHDSKEVPA